MHDERRHDEAHDVVYQERGEQAAAEDDGRQEMMRLEPFDEPFGDPVEEPDDAKIRDDQHHRKQQHDGGEVDRGQRFLRADDTEGDHQDGADDRRSWTVDFRPGELAQREYEVAAKEDQVPGKNARVGQQGGIERGHRPELEGLALSDLTLSCATGP